MKKQTIGAIIAIVGLFLAVCTADGCKYEIGMRFAGVALTATGAFLGGWFRCDDDKDDPYIEEIRK